MDEMGKSAISELGNMISGNASTLLYNQGIRVDITPPRLVEPAVSADMTRHKALTVPLIMDRIGEMDIHVFVA